VLALIIDFLVKLARFLICIYVVKHVDATCDSFYTVVGLFELIGMR
jgi:hypothetical protein